MSFYLYEVQGNDVVKTCIQRDEIELSGENGPIKKILLKEKYIVPGQNMAWHTTSKNIIEEIGMAPQKHEIIIDFKPKAVTNVSLLRLLDLWGYTCEEYTPVALLLEVLYMDHKMEPSKIASFKKIISLENKVNDKVCEFLYLCGGFKENAGSGYNWQWGKAGRVNGAILWPDAFSYFTNEIAKKFN